MKQFLNIFILLFCGVIANAQTTNIAGVVNDYTPVTAINFCDNTVTVSSTLGFDVGERVMLIQMKGAEIKTDNDSDFGKVTDLNGAGDFEILTIASITGASILFDKAILKDYYVSGAVQLVTVAEYTNANVIAEITAQPWDGSSGGVVVLDVQDTLTLNEDIDASFLGFRGGSIRNVTPCFNGGIGGYSGYGCRFVDNCGAPKGEGIANYNSDYELGRGPLGNGGGGGNDHNTGGGGGGNFGSGGIGGERRLTSNVSCPGKEPGIGGYANDYSGEKERMFFGGGGGAGEENNNEGTSGGNGGGIIFISANVLAGNNFFLRANGQTVVDTAQTDGAGAGGAGGTILLDVNTYNGNINAVLNGGNGGYLNNGRTVSFCMGPGGGGAGGAVLTTRASLSTNVNTVWAGGTQGTNVHTAADPDCLFTDNGAMPGEEGGSSTNHIVIESDKDFIPVVANARGDTIVCKYQPAKIFADGEGCEISFLWNTGDETTEATVVPERSNFNTVTVTDWRGCESTAGVFIEVSDPKPSVSASPNTTISLGSSVQLSATFAPDWTYSWLPTNFMDDPSIHNPIAVPETEVTYCVNVVDTLGCTGEDCITIQVEEPNIVVPDAFTPNGDNLNDFIFPIYEDNLTLLDFSVFNRWGELVYNSNASTGWDGKYNSQNQPIGTYVYTATLQHETGLGPKIIKTGGFSLLR